MVLASMAIVLALVAAYARHAAVNSDQFANRATVALRDDSVRSLIAQKLTDEVILKNQADLIAARPIIESVASDVVGGRAFTNLFRKAVRDVHRALFKRDQNTVTLTIADVGAVLAAALEQVRPELARKLQSTERVELVERNIGSLSATLANIAERVQLLAVLLLVLSLVLVAGALLLAPDRRQAVVELGVAVAVAGVLLVVAYSVARSLAVDHVDGPDEQAAARAVWDAFLGDLRTAASILAACGVVVAAAAASLIEPRPFGEPLRVAGRWLATEPRRPVLRVLRGVAFAAAGVVVLVERDAVLALLMSALGVYLIYEGMSAVLRLVYRPREAGAVARGVGARGAAIRQAVRTGGDRGARDRSHRRRVLRQRRDHDRRAREGCVQRSQGAVRPNARRGRARGHPQLDVGAAARLVLLGAGAPNRRPAGRRCPGPLDRHSLRRPTSERQGPHLLRKPCRSSASGPRSMA